MVMFYIVVCVHVFAELPFTGLHFLVPGFFFGSKVSVVSDDILKPCKNLAPVQFHIGTIGFLQSDAFTAALNPAPSRYGMGAAALSILIFKEIRFFFGTVSTGKIAVNAPFAALDITASVQRGIDLILGDKHSHR